MLDRHPAERHFPTKDRKYPVEVIAVDDRHPGALPLDRDITMDIEIAGRIVVLAGTRNCQRDRPAGTMIVSALGLALAASIAERSEIWPEASLPVFKFTATVSSSRIHLESREHQAWLEIFDSGRDPGLSANWSVLRFRRLEHHSPPG